MSSDQEKAAKCIECGHNDAAMNASRTWRCGQCNALRRRLQRMFGSSGEETKQAFAAMSKEDKLEFYRAHHSSMGEHLAAAVEEVRTKTVATSSSFEVRGVGTFLDEEDLRKKYESKPEQLQSILANAKQVVDHTRGCTLYEDIAYVSKATQSERTDEELKRSISVHEDLKKSKKAKVTKTEVVADSVQATEGVAAKGFTAAQMKYIDKTKESCTEMLEKFAGFLECVDKEVLAGLISGVVIAKAHAFSCTVKEFIAVVDGALEAGSGDMKEIKAAASTIKSNGLEHIRRFSVQIEEARLLKDEDAAPQEEGSASAGDCQ